MKLRTYRGNELLSEREVNLRPGETLTVVETEGCSVVLEREEEPSTDWAEVAEGIRRANEEQAPEPTYTQLAANGWKDPRIAPSAEPRMFPIMGGPAIPWGVIAPHERRAKLNHGGQSLQRLAERGGLSPSEAVAVLEDRKWRAMSDEAALAGLKVLAGWLPPGEVERRVAQARDEALEEAARWVERDTADTTPPRMLSLVDEIRALKPKKEDARGEGGT